MNVKQLLFEHLSTLEREQGRRITLKELAGMIGMDDKYFNHVYNMSQKPSEKVVDQFYDFFGDIRFYDVCGMERPDPMLRHVMRTWGNLSLASKDKIAKIIGYDKPQENG